MAATLDRLSDGRLLINLVTGGDPDELAGDGLFVDHDTRYEITDEFLHIWRELLAKSHQDETVDYDGKHLQSKGAKLLYPPLQQPHPPLYFGGSSAAAHQDLAAEQVETYLTWGEPPAAVAEKIADIRARAEARGRKIKFGIRLHVIVRETEEEAWQAAADRLISHLDDDTIARAQQAFAKMDSEGQRRMAALHGGKRGSRQDLEVYPNLWAGVGLVRGGAGTALVGDRTEQVAARMREYAELGIDTFILSGYPHLEESYRVAELVFPLIKGESATRRSGPLSGPFGEMVANDITRPRRARAEGGAHGNSCTADSGPVPLDRPRRGTTWLARDRPLAGTDRPDRGLGTGRAYRRAVHPRAARAARGGARGLVADRIGRHVGQRQGQHLARADRLSRSAAASAWCWASSPACRSGASASSTVRCR